MLRTRNNTNWMIQQATTDNHSARAEDRVTHLKSNRSRLLKIDNRSLEMRGAHSNMTRWMVRCTHPIHQLDILLWVKAKACMIIKTSKLQSSHHILKEIMHGHVQSSMPQMRLSGQMNLSINILETHTTIKAFIHREWHAEAEEVSGTATNARETNAEVVNHHALGEPMAALVVEAMLIHGMFIIISSGNEKKEKYCI